MKKSFLKTKRGVIVLIVWIAVGISILPILSSLLSKYSEFLEHKKQQEEVVTIITSVTDEYDRYPYMSEKMVAAIALDYCPVSFYGTSASDSLKQAAEKKAAAARTAREAVATLMQNKGYVGFDSWDVEQALKNYDFASFDGDQHLAGCIMIPILILGAAATNIVLVISHKRQTHMPDNL